MNSFSFQAPPTSQPPKSMTDGVPVRPARLPNSNLDVEEIFQAEKRKSEDMSHPGGGDICTKLRRSSMGDMIQVVSDDVVNTVENRQSSRRKYDDELQEPDSLITHPTPSLLPIALPDPVRSRNSTSCGSHSDGRLDSKLINSCEALEIVQTPPRSESALQFIQESLVSSSPEMPVLLPYHSNSESNENTAYKAGKSDKMDKTGPIQPPLSFSNKDSDNGDLKLDFTIGREENCLKPGDRQPPLSIPKSLTSGGLPASPSADNLQAELSNTKKLLDNPGMSVVLENPAGGSWNEADLYNENNADSAADKSNDREVGTGSSPHTGVSNVEKVKPQSNTLSLPKKKDDRIFWSEYLGIYK